MSDNQAFCWPFDVSTLIVLPLLKCSETSPHFCHDTLPSESRNVSLGTGAGCAALPEGTGQVAIAAAELLGQHVIIVFISLI